MLECNSSSTNPAQNITIMPEDPYSIDQTESVPNQEPMDRGSEEERSTDGETALLPKSIFSDKTLEPGSTCKFEVVKVHGDEVEVKYVKEEEPEPEADMMASSMGGLDQLAQGYG